MNNIYCWLVAGLAASQTFTAAAQNKATQYVGLTEGAVTAISPDGQKMAGKASTYGDEQGFRSFVWDAESKKQEWKTQYDEADLDKSGAFEYITNSGIAAGEIRDKDMKVDVPATDYTPASSFYVTNAAVWRDGKLYKLGVGEYDYTQFIDATDGSYAKGVSDDGSIVVGYMNQSWMPQEAMAWKYDQGNDSYSYFRMAMPEGSSLSQATALSADGKTAVGAVNIDNVFHAVVWTTTSGELDTYKVVDLGLNASEITKGEATAISPNGHYALISVSTADGSKMAVYDVTADKAEEVTMPTEIYDSKGLTIDNNGNFFCQLTDMATYTPATYYYSAGHKNFVKMDYFVQQYAPDAEGIPSNIGQAIPAGMSADGTMIAANIAGATGMPVGLWLKVNTSALIVPAVDGVEAFTSGIDRVTVKWNVLTGLDEGMTLKGYNVYVDGKKTATVTADEAGTSATIKHVVEAKAGQHTFAVSATVEAEGNETEAPLSTAVTLNMPSSYILPLAEDFEKGTFDTNSWTTDLIEGSSSEILIWNVAGGDYENATYFASVSSTVQKPWKAALYSRFFDASDADDVTVSFSSKVAEVNTSYKDFSGEKMAIEYSTDGENWETLATENVEDMALYKWNITKEDFSKQLAGKQFKLRFLAQSEGKAALKWYLDYVTIGTKTADKKPEGLTATKSGDGKRVDLKWANSFGAYEKSYLVNSSQIYDYNIGNEGKPLIAAVSFPAGTMDEYIGKYISSVSAFYYVAPELGGEIKADAIVYEDGKEVARKTFATTDFTVVNSQTVALDTPVKIEAGKEYRIGLRVYDYDASIAPLFYQASKEGYVPGQSDLYSEDEGKTWNLISDFNAGSTEEAKAYCIWPIRANITDAAASDPLVLDNTILGYNVYRDGVQLNNELLYSPYLKYTDNAPVAGAKYTVQAFYTDGSASLMSDPAEAVTSSISGIGADKADVRVDNTARTVSIDGTFDKASLVSADGRIVRSAVSSTFSTEGLTRGLYILKIEAGGHTSAHKIVVK